MKSQVKESELHNRINADEIAELAEDKFHKDNIKRSRLSTKIAHHMPKAAIIVMGAAVIVSAPFTVTFFSLVFSPILIWSIDFKAAFINITPIVIEGVIILLSAVRAYGNGNWMQTLLLILLLTFSTLVNVLGAISALQIRGIDTWLDYAYVGTAVLAGILVSSVGYIVGEIVIKMATGKITMEIDPSELWTGIVRDEALRRAFENEASKHTSIGRAVKYAAKMVKRYSDIPTVVNKNIDALGNAVSQSLPVDSVFSVSNEMGFSPMAKVNVPLQTATTEQTQLAVRTYPIKDMSEDAAIEWLQDNPDGWQQWANYETKLKRCQSIAYHLTGKIKGAKSIDRAMKTLNIEY